MGVGTGVGTGGIGSRIERAPAVELAWASTDTTKAQQDISATALDTGLVIKAHAYHGRFSDWSRAHFPVDPSSKIAVRFDLLYWSVS